jgi:hypothetical protein
MDRRLIDKSLLIEYQPPPEDDDNVDMPDMAPASKSSAKIRKLVELLRLVEPDSKRWVVPFRVTLSPYHNLGWSVSSFPNLLASSIASRLNSTPPGSRTAA